MARNKIMKVWYWSLNSEWTYIIDDNTLVGGASVPLPLSYIDSSVPGEISILDDSIYIDFIDVSMIILNPLFAPSGESLYLKNNVSFMLDDYVTFFDLASLGSFAGGSSVDLTPVLLAIENLSTDISSMFFGINDHIDGAVSSVNGPISGVESQLTGLSSQLNDQMTGVHTHLDTFNVDLTPVIDLLTPLQTAELNNLHEDIVSLGNQLSTVTVPLQSLNGNGSEYKDGVQVLVTGRLPVYTVSRSYMSMMDTDTYTCVYDLEAPDGSKTTCPESFLTPYVAPVVTL